MLYRLVALGAFVGSADAMGGYSSSPPPPSTSGSTCYDIKKAYQNSQCCSSNLQMTTEYEVEHLAAQPTIKSGTNPCAGTKPYDALDSDATLADGTPHPLANPLSVPGLGYFNNVNCSVQDFIDGAITTVEQSAANVTKGYVGGFDVGARTPTVSYLASGLCPVNVHWHLGAEHLSVGEFDEDGSGPTFHTYKSTSIGGRRLAGLASSRLGFQCHHYDSTDPKFTAPYEWKHCVDTEVGQTYEIHWPHSTDGACGTPNQYQTPFYDGVFCNLGKYDEGAKIKLNPLNTWENIGVQGQVFTIVNDENYYYPDLMRGMIVDGEMGQDIAKYTGSTTGTSRNNEKCSRYTPITWHVDRKCHLISASSFDKMCADMKAQRDDMSGDLYPHGSRELVDHAYAANNHVRK